MVKDGSMDIEMGQAVAGIKGTIFILNETNTESKLAVLEGEVEFKSKAKKENTKLSAGEQIAADSNGLKTKEKFNLANEIKKWETNQYHKIESKKNKLIYGILIIILIIISSIFIINKKKNK